MTTSALASVSMQMDGLAWFVMALGFLTFAALLLWLGATLARAKRTGPQAPPEEVSALHLLDRRLAQGQITAEQREDARRILAG